MHDGTATVPHPGNEPVLGYAPGKEWRAELEWGAKLNGAKVAAALVLFPRPAPPEKAAAPAKG